MDLMDDINVFLNGHRGKDELLDSIFREKCVDLLPPKKEKLPTNLGDVVIEMNTENCDEVDESLQPGKSNGNEEGVEKKEDSNSKISENSGGDEENPYERIITGREMEYIQSKGGFFNKNLESCEWYDYERFSWKGIYYSMIFSVIHGFRTRWEYVTVFLMLVYLNVLTVSVVVIFYLLLSTFEILSVGKFKWVTCICCCFMTRRKIDNKNSEKTFLYEDLQTREYKIYSSRSIVETVLMIEKKRESASRKFVAAIVLVVFVVLTGGYYFGNTFFPRNQINKIFGVNILQDAGAPELICVGEVSYQYEYNSTLCPNIHEQEKNGLNTLEESCNDITYPSRLRNESYEKTGVEEDFMFYQIGFPYTFIKSFRKNVTLDSLQKRIEKNASNVLVEENPEIRAIYYFTPSFCELTDKGGEFMKSIIVSGVVGFVVLFIARVNYDGQYCEEMGDAMEHLKKKKRYFPKVAVEATRMLKSSSADILNDLLTSLFYTKSLSKDPNGTFFEGNFEGRSVVSHVDWGIIKNLSFFDIGYLQYFFVDHPFKKNLKKKEKKCHQKDNFKDFMKSIASLGLLCVPCVLLLVLPIVIFVFIVLYRMAYYSFIGKYVVLLFEIVSVNARTNSVLVFVFYIVTMVFVGIILFCSPLSIIGFSKLDEAYVNLSNQYHRDGLFGFFTKREKEEKKKEEETNSLLTNCCIVFFGILLLPLIFISFPFMLFCILFFVNPAVLIILTAVDKFTVDEDKPERKESEYTLADYASGECHRELTTKMEEKREFLMNCLSTKEKKNFLKKYNKIQRNSLTTKSHIKVDDHIEIKVDDHTEENKQNDGTEGKEILEENPKEEQKREKSEEMEESFQEIKVEDVIEYCVLNNNISYLGSIIEKWGVVPIEIDGKLTDTTLWDDESVRKQNYSLYQLGRVYCKRNLRELYEKQ